jgi:hypothetical protein
MSIKYLQDQQLNQVQQSPNNSPWAKLIAQSEMLERNKMRQPQGQAPQGTVAGNIQQQLIDAQMKQESETQNADLYKSQMLAQLIGSGQIPANFSAQGYADGGLAQPQAGTGAYRGIMMPSQGAGANPSYAPKQPVLSYIPPSSQDPAAQEKKHGMLQTLLDNSMYSGKGTIDSNMQMYSDMLTGKLFGRGFAEGGDVRGFAAGGESMAEQLARIKPQIEATLRDQGWTKEAIDRYVSAYKPEMGRGFTNQFPATTAQPPSFEDMLNLQRQKAAQTGEGIKPFTAEPEPPHPFQQAAEERAARLREELQLAPHREAAEARAAKLQAIQQQAAGAQRVLPAPGPTSASSLESVLGKDANVQDFINSLKSKQLTTTGEPPSATPEGLENPPAVRTGTGLPAETNYGKGATIDAPYFVHPNATPNADATAKSAWDSMDILDRAKNNWDKGQSTEAKAWLASQAQANTPVEGKLPVPYDPMAPGATTFEDIAAKAKQGLGSLGEAASAVGRPIAKVAGALSPIGDLMMANKFTGGSNALLAQALSGQTPSGAMQGDISEVAKDLMTAPSVPNWAKNIGSAINSKVPSVPQTDISQFGVDTKAAIPQQPTIGDFSGSATPQTKGPATNEKGVIANPNSANKHESTTANTAAINQAHGQGQTQATSPVTQAVQQAATVAQADQAANRSSDTGMGQGSILDSLYSKLKDTDVDYSDLAKRISENEYDLARERKDGTFNAILGGVGAALSKAGSYEGAGDRVFRPGYGAIAGAGIMGGLKMANESDAAIAKKSQDNTMSMLALKKLKGDSLNNVLDAISAQKQTDVYAQSVANNAVAHRDTAANNAMKNEIDRQQLIINGQTALKNMEHLDAQIADLYNKASSDPNLQGKVNLAADKAKTAKDVLTSLTNGMVQPSDPRYIEATSKFNAAFADLNSLGIALKIPTTVVPNAGSQTPQTTEEWAQQGYIKR